MNPYPLGLTNINSKFDSDVQLPEFLWNMLHVQIHMYMVHGYAMAVVGRRCLDKQPAPMPLHRSSATRSHEPLKFGVNRNRCSLTPQLHPKGISKKMLPIILPIMSNSPDNVRNNSDGNGGHPSLNRKGLQERAMSMLSPAVTLDNAM